MDDRIAEIRKRIELARENAIIVWPEEHQMVFADLPWALEEIERLQAVVQSAQHNNRNIERIIQKARAEERERCLKIVAEYTHHYGAEPTGLIKTIAERIRAGEEG